MKETKLSGSKPVGLNWSALKPSELLFRYGSIFVMLFIFILFSVRNENFFTYNNLTSILLQISIVAFLAIAVTFSQVVDGFDLSVGSTMSLSVVVTATLMVWYEMPLFWVVLIPLVLGVLIGVVNAFLIVKLRIPDLLATLSMMYLISGIQRTYTEGRSITNKMLMADGSQAPGAFTESFLWIGQGKLFGLSFPVVLMLITVIAVYIFLHHTKWGRRMYITGGNREAARLSGIGVKRIRLYAYMLSGFFAALAGVLFAGRVGSGQIDAGAGLLMEAVAAVFIGYSVFGAGKANVFGTFLGALLIGILVNGLTMFNLQYYSRDIVKGIVLVAALAVTFVHLNKRST